MLSKYLLIWGCHATGGTSSGLAQPMVGQFLPGRPVAVTLETGEMLPRQKYMEAGCNCVVLRAEGTRVLIFDCNGFCLVAMGSNHMGLQHSLWLQLLAMRATLDGRRRRSMLTISLHGIGNGLNRRSCLLLAAIPLLTRLRLFLTGR